MGTVLKNAMLVDIDPPKVESGALRVEGGRIAERGAQVARSADDTVVDCGGAVVFPGFVNGHAHLYSALAAGMPAPPKSPHNFVEILEYVWWRLDRGLDAESIEMSGRIGALDAVRCGTTAMIDHHASPDCIVDSLDFLERGIADAGTRAVLCYETTDRNGRAGRDAGIEENRRYLDKFRSKPSEQFAGMVGAHASFTLEDDTLDEMAAVTEKLSTGVHIHVAEDPADEQHCRDKHKQSLVDRLAGHGLMTPKAVYAHGTHLDAKAIAKLNEVGVTLAHNPRSNMNNGVGYTPVPKFECPVMLGTDGIGGDMFTEAKHAWFKSCDAHAGLSPARVVAMLAASARRASAALGVTLGKLAPDAAADIVLTNFRPGTPLTGDNFAGQFIFAMGSQHVTDVMIDGRWVLRDRQITTCDEAAVRQESRRVAQGLWERMAKIACA
jgi:putative selenium metabolism protein SsnA